MDEIQKAALVRFHDYLKKASESTNVLRVLIGDLLVPSALVVKKLGVSKATISRALHRNGSLEIGQSRLLLEMLSTTLDTLEKDLGRAEKHFAKEASTSKVFSERLPVVRAKLETGRKVMEREKENLAER